MLFIYLHYWGVASVGKGTRHWSLTEDSVKEVDEYLTPHTSTEMAQKQWETVTLWKCRMPVWQRRVPGRGALLGRWVRLWQELGV